MDTDEPVTPPAQPCPCSVLVWDVPTRLFHWLVVLLVPAAYATWKLNWMDWHVRIGEFDFPPAARYVDQGLPCGFAARCVYDVIRMLALLGFCRVAGRGYQRLTGRSLRDCPACGKGHMVCIEIFLPGALPRAPPHIHHGH